MSDQPKLTDQFVGLPLGLLVCSPIIEVAKGQADRSQEEQSNPAR